MVATLVEFSSSPAKAPDSVSITTKSGVKSLCSAMNASRSGQVSVISWLVQAFDRDPVRSTLSRNALGQDVIGGCGNKSSTAWLRCFRRIILRPPSASGQPNLPGCRI